MVRVAKHKTFESSGTAPIVVSDFLKTRISDHVQSIQLRQVDNCDDCGNLFVLCGGKPLYNMADKVKRVAPRFRFTAVSLTKVRKSAVTKTAYEEPTTRARFAQPISHSVDIENAYYALVKSNKKAAQAIADLHSKPKPKKTSLFQRRNRKDHKVLYAIYQRQKYSKHSGMRNISKEVPF